MPSRLGMVALTMLGGACMVGYLGLVLWQPIV